MQSSIVSDATAMEFLRFSEWTAGGLLIGLVAAVVIAGVASVLTHRLVIQSSQPDSAESSMTRPVLALTLVGTLVLLAAGALTLGDKQTRNLLIGGVVSLSSAAVAFYFSSTGAKEARRDMMKATSGTTVPDLVGKTFMEAQAAISLTSLMLVKPDPDPQTKKITSQRPEAGTSAAAGTTVTLVFEP
jgi:PASTA domain